MTNRSLWLRLVCVGLIVNTVALPFETGMASPARAETIPLSPLTRASELTEDGKDADVVLLLRPLLSGGAFTVLEERRTALDMLGKAYIHLGEVASADTMFFHLAQADRTWKPTEMRYSEEELPVARAAYQRAHVGMLKSLTTWRKPAWKDAKTYLYPAIVGVGIWLATRDGSTTTSPTLLPDPPPPPAH
jgi:hypothetical protein